MTHEDVKAFALEIGFTLREQPDGTMDLNPYVYAFAEKIEKAERERWAPVVEALYDAALDTIASGRPVGHLDSTAYTVGVLLEQINLGESL